MAKFISAFVFIVIYLPAMLLAFVDVSIAGEIPAVAEPRQNGEEGQKRRNPAAYSDLPTELKAKIHSHLPQGRHAMHQVSKHDNFISQEDLNRHKRKIQEFQKTLPLDANIIDEAILRDRTDVIKATRVTKNDLKPSGKINFKDHIVHAAQTKNTHLLKEYFAHPHLKDRNPEVLIEEAKEGRTANVETLLKAGANPNLKDRGQAPLHWAAVGGHAESVKLLINGKANPQVEGPFKTTPLHLAAKAGKIEIVQILMTTPADREAKDSHGNTPLHLAAENGHTEIVNVLIKDNVNPNAKNNLKSTPLHLAAEQGQTETAKSLIHANARPNAKDLARSTPLHLAAEKGHLETAKVLIEANANLDGKDSDGKTPSDYVQPHTKIAELLEEAAKKQRNKPGEILESH